jgi:hypothetical protein
MDFSEGCWCITIGTDVVALAEETQAVATGTAAEGARQDTGENTMVDGGDVVSVGGFVAAGDLGVVAALGLSLGQGRLGADGELDAAVSTLTGLGKSHRSGGENESGGEELHLDLMVGLDARTAFKGV